MSTLRVGKSFLGRLPSTILPSPLIITESSPSYVSAYNVLYLTMLSLPVMLIVYSPVFVMVLFSTILFDPTIFIPLTKRVLNLLSVSIMLSPLKIIE